jgi:hypothetical protein
MPNLRRLNSIPEHECLDDKPTTQYQYIQHDMTGSLIMRILDRQKRLLQEQNKNKQLISICSSKN